MQRYNGQHDNERERSGRRESSRRGYGRDFEDQRRDDRGRFTSDDDDDDERRFDEDRDEDREWLLRDEDRFGPRRFQRQAPDFSQHRGRYGEEQRYYAERSGRGFGRFGEGQRERFGGGGFSGGAGRGFGEQERSFGQQQGGFGQNRDWQQQQRRPGEFGPREWSEWQPQPAAGRWGGLGTDRGPHFGKGPKGYQRSEQRVLEDVNDALERHPEIDASEITVACENGVIVLRGTVESRHAKRLAEECVEDLSGVKDVRNELRTQAAGAESGQRATSFESSQRDSEKQRKM